MTERFSKSKIRAAGGVLAGRSSKMTREEALAVADAWRLENGRALDEMSSLLADVVRDQPFGREAQVVSRLKRMDSIVGKLARAQSTHELDTMYDIAGCRAIVPDCGCVEALVQDLRTCACVRKGIDYIACPAPSGYRSFHLVTEHGAASGGRLLCAETQIRTRLQHYWATSVETYDVFTGADLKGGGKPQGKGARFFQLAGSLLALQEGSPLVPGTPRSKGEIVDEMRSLESSEHILARLGACSDSVDLIVDGFCEGEFALCLMHIDYAEQQVLVCAYGADQIEEANAAYVMAERSKQGLEDVLLVKVSTLSDLRAGYPNYSSDVNGFLAAVKDAADGAL